MILTVFLPILLKKYGMLVDRMTKIKMEDGFIVRLTSELKPLADKKWLLSAKLFECPKCKSKKIVPDNTRKSLNCQNDNVPYVFQRKVFILSDKAYEAWTVWMEEYSRYMLQRLPCNYVKSGVSLKPLGPPGVTDVEEIDVVVVYNGLLIAIECVEELSCSQHKNDVNDIISKIHSLGLFDGVILVYKTVDKRHNFNSTVKKYQKFIYPVLVQSPSSFKRKLHKALSQLQITLSTHSQTVSKR